MDPLAARDSIYEAEGEGSSVKLSQEFIHNASIKSLEKERLISAPSNEALIDPSSIAKGADDALTANVRTIVESE